jgi:hypothetical protein
VYCALCDTLQAVSQAGGALSALLVHHVHTLVVAASVTAMFALKGLSLTVVIQHAIVSNYVLLQTLALLLPLRLYTAHNHHYHCQ